jgi:hypothetical protein
MTEGWKLFLHNLELHRRHFPGRWGTSILPSAQWAGPSPDALASLTGALGLPTGLAAGDRVDVDPSTSGSPALSGTVVRAEPSRMSLLLDGPVEGTAFLAAEGRDEQVMVSVWMYGYGDGAEAWAATDGPAWHAWLEERAG